MLRRKFLQLLGIAPVAAIAGVPAAGSAVAATPVLDVGDGVFSANGLFVDIKNGVVSIRSDMLIDGWFDPAPGDVIHIDGVCYDIDSVDG